MFRTYDIVPQKSLLHWHVEGGGVCTGSKPFHSCFGILNICDLGFGNTVIPSHATWLVLAISHSQRTRAFCLIKLY